MSSEPLAFPLPKLVTSVGLAQRQKDGGYELNNDNLYLALYRLAPKEVGEGTGNDDKSSRKHHYLTALARRWDKLKSEWESAGSPVTSYAERQGAQLRVLQEAGAFTRQLELDTEGRLVAGLGYDSPLEVGLSLHPLYGFPYLPGSSVKGVARSFAETVAGASEEDLLVVFGSTTKNETEAQMQQGAVRFLDAIPTAHPDLEVDVMTPHYGAYYIGDAPSPPGEWHHPVPVPFLTVAAGATFRFSLYSRDEEALVKAAEWMREGLFWLGAGGKTAAGYGLFTNSTRQEQAEVRRRAWKEEKEKRTFKANLPPKLRRLKKRATGVLARVLGPSKDPQGKLDAELHVEGFEGKRVPVMGRFNPEGFDVGEWIEVDVERKRKKKTPLMRYKRRYKG
jgi:CRISPR-associated protein Cmr6